MIGLKALFRANLLASARNKIELFFTFAFPLIFIVVFGLIFGSQEVTPGKSVIDYLAPGVMAWGVGNAAVFGVAYTLVKWRTTDLLRLIRRTPTSMIAMLLSRFAVVVIIALVQAALFLAVAAMPPFRLHINAVGLLSVLPVLVFGALAFFTIGVVVGNASTSPDAVGAIANCIMIPMAFLSGSFIPLNQSPAWLRAVSRALPLRYMNSATTGVLSGDGRYGNLAICCLILIGFAAVFGFIALRTFRWVKTS